VLVYTQRIICFSWDHGRKDDCINF
jgi:hypothetical protein